MIKLCAVNLISNLQFEKIDHFNYKVFLKIRVGNLQGFLKFFSYSGFVMVVYKLF